MEQPTDPRKVNSHRVVLTNNMGIIQIIVLRVEFKPYYLLFLKIHNLQVINLVYLIYKGRVGHGDFLFLCSFANNHVVR